MPFGLLHLMNSKKDWNFKTQPSPVTGRSIKVNRGKLTGGSSSINSMVWFRGRRDDFDQWNIPGWRANDLDQTFNAVEAEIAPARLPHPHPLSDAFGKVFPTNNPMLPPTPERESAAVFHTNMRNGRRWSSADAFLRPAIATGRVTVINSAQVDRVCFSNNTASSVNLIDGRQFHATRGIILSAGAIASPAILQRSGIGPAALLRQLNIPLVADHPRVGQNLQDHPVVGVHLSLIHI